MFKYNKALSMCSTRKIFGKNTATCLVKINVNFSNVPCYIVLLIFFQVNLRYLQITYRNFLRESSQTVLFPISLGHVGSLTASFEASIKIHLNLLRNVFGKIFKAWFLVYWNQTSDDKPKLHIRCEPDRLKINTLVCHATPDRTFVTNFAYPVFWWPDNSHSLFQQKWSKVNITSLYIRLEQKTVISWDANRLWVWRVSLVREGGGGGGGEVRLSMSYTLQCFQACWLAELVGTGFIESTDRFMAKQLGTSGIEPLLEQVIIRSWSSAALLH